MTVMWWAIAGGAVGVALAFMVDRPKRPRRHR